MYVEKKDNTYAWDYLMSTLYTGQDQELIERLIGYALEGFHFDSPGPDITVLSGGPATGKSTVLHIIEKMLLRSPAPWAIVQHDWDGKNAHRFMPGYIVFTASNLENISAPDEFKGRIRVIRQHCESRPIFKELYERLLHDIDDELDDIMKKCRSRVRTRLPYQPLSRK